MRRLGYVLTAAWQGFWRNPVMSIAATLTVSLMLLLFAFFVVTDRGLQAAVGALESKVELVLYLDDGAKPSDILALKTRIEKDPAVASVLYITKQQALDRLRELAQRKEDFTIADLGTNPLPASLEIKLGNAQDAGRLATSLKDELGRGVVTDVIDNPTVVEKLLTITRVLSVGGIAVLAMMLFVALFVIVNTIRIAVHARRDEIEIMQLVGATDWFVSWPFILEGMLVGTFGAIVALAVLALASQPVTSAMVGFLDILPVSLGANFILQLAIGVLGFALLVGGGGASLSVRSQLAKGVRA
ncbi:MAG: cell division transport system permease protein [Chloroflexota bacterium]|jgi:cell division transport system permease protein|nr:cell division transport system permease protein [Chloroflexota bacterium]